MATYETSSINMVTPVSGEWTASGGSSQSYSFSTIDPEASSFAPGDEIATNSPLFGETATYVGSYNDGFIIQDNDGGYWWVGSGAPLPSGHDFTVNDEDPLPVCFLEGTLIATPTGERTVESLAPGDVILTADGQTCAVRWVGRQSIVSIFAIPEAAYPIKVAVGALADNVPHRDLFVSPDHALVIDGTLVHAGALVNGTSVTRVAQPAARFTYFHIETENHAVILAQGAPAETFVDNVTRARFDNYAEFVALFGDEASSHITEQDAPRVKSARQLPGTIRDLMGVRAQALGLVRGEKIAA